MIATIILAVIAGLIIGVFAGLLGIGGGLMMVPIFRVAFSMSAIASTATSLFAIIPTSISGAVSHVRRRTCVPKLGIAMGLGGACTSPIGVWAAQLSPSWLIILATVIIIAYSAINMFQKALKAPRGIRAVALDATPEPPPTFSPTARNLVQGALVGLFAGLASGYVGVGGGFIMIPLMLSIMKLPMKLASGTSLIAVMILALPGVIEQIVLGNVNYVAGIAIIVGTIPGAFLGARLVNYLPERTLRFIFAAFLVVAAILLALKETALLG